MTTTENPNVSRCTVIHLQPDDVLIIGNVGELTPADVDTLRESIAGAGLTHHLLIFPADIDLSVVRKADLS